VEHGEDSRVVCVKNGRDCGPLGRPLRHEAGDIAAETESHRDRYTSQSESLHLIHRIGGMAYFAVFSLPF
jgi:hypothetical protein